MSTSNIIKCACCDNDVEENEVSVDTDLNEPVCPACVVLLRWACAKLRRRTTDGVSVTGIHGPHEKPIPWDPRIAENEWQKWLKTQGDK